MPSATMRYYCSCRLDSDSQTVQSAWSCRFCPRCAPKLADTLAAAGCAAWHHPWFRFPQTATQCRPHRHPPAASSLLANRLQRRRLENMARNAEMLLALGLAKPQVAYHRDSNCKLAATSGNATGHSRPRGRAPNGKRWDDLIGCWVSDMSKGKSIATAPTAGRSRALVLRRRARAPRLKRAAATKARQVFTIPPLQSARPSRVPMHRLVDSEPRQTPADRGSGDPQDRIGKSQCFNRLRVGAQVKIVANYKCGHHDLTSSNPGLQGCLATVVKVPIYPSTWFSLEVDTAGVVVKARTSQMARVCDVTSIVSATKDSDRSNDDKGVSRATITAAAATTSTHQPTRDRRGTPRNATAPKANSRRFYKVDRFLRACAGKILVKWVGFPLQAATWEPLVKLRQDMGPTLTDQELALLRRPHPHPSPSSSSN